jgi:hypothetical protein
MAKESEKISSSRRTPSPAGISMSEDQVGEKLSRIIRDAEARDMTPSWLEKLRPGFSQPSMSRLARTQELQIQKHRISDRVKLFFAVFPQDHHPMRSAPDNLGTTVQGISQAVA